MLRISKKLFRRSRLYESSAVHHAGPVAETADQGQVMSDKEKGETPLSLEAAEEADDLSLDGDIQRSGGFVRMPEIPVP